MIATLRPDALEPRADGWVYGYNQVDGGPGFGDMIEALRLPHAQAVEIV